MLSLREIKRRKMFQVAAVYAVTAWLIVEVITSIEEPLSLPPWSDTLVIVLLALGLPIMLIVSWLFNITADGLVLDEGPVKTQVRPGITIELILVGIIAVAVAWLFYRTEFDRETVPEETPAVASAQGTTTNSVAVLPFANLSADPDDAYFTAGLHEEILNRLANLRNVRVISRTSVLQYADTELKIPEIANELNVSTILEGSVQYADGRVRIHAQLIDAVTDEHIWAETYEKKFEDIFAIESSIATNIANALHAEFSLAEQQRLDRVPTTSVEAYRHYLGAPPPPGQPREFGAPPPGSGPPASGPPGSGPPGRAARLDQLNRSIEADPNFAAAYVERAGIYIQDLLTPETPERSQEEETNQENLALDDIERALDIDPELGRAYAWRGVMHRYNWRGSDAKSAFEAALELSPNDPEVLTQYSYLLSNLGRYEEAIEVVQRAVRFDPRNPDTQAALAQFNTAAGHYDEAATAFRAAAAGHTAWLLPLAANNEIARGNLEEAETLLRHSEHFAITTESPQWPALVAYNFALLNLADDAVRLMARYDELADHQRTPAAAEIMASLARGNEEDALRALLEAASEKVPYEAFDLLMGIAANAYRDPILDKPEFAAARQSLRLASR